ncbi:MAG TPA: sigma-70 family RNA polymerase sigma factor [Puia sp.]|nr:sigma-70 family RNA polymerase sigma factor [Puia sp.]
MRPVTGNTYNEKLLLDAMAKGSGEAFEQIYLHYYKAVRTNIFSMLRDEDQADDILQEVFLRFWDRRQKFAESDKAGGWLFVVSYNASLRFLEKLRRDKAANKMYVVAEEVVTEDYPSEQEIRSIDRQLDLLSQAIDRLPPQRRRVFELCRFQGKTYEQAATDLSIAKSTVKDHLEQAAASIRKYIETHSASDSAEAIALLVAIFAGLYQ